ncbi:ScpA family protein [Roseomonas sp. 18066]|uniref:segregation and condensation protein A n=1 Tax=Roseomonas sp. 18066 TaxID=2681412 RepID=UPI001F39E96A|nr:ScpA family protein [Roseomonas sp. 18066]
MSEAPLLSIEGFEGPLDFLLEMLGRKRIDLAALPIAEATDQLATALQDSAGRVPLAQRGDWLVMAAELVLLKSRLLAPRNTEEALEAEQEAQRRLAQLETLAAMRAAAALLSARPQLGRDVFARGAPERPAGPPRAAAQLAFLEALLVLLEGPLPRGEAFAVTYRPPPQELWRVPEALALFREMLPGLDTPRSLEKFLPKRRRRGDLSSTFVAALELAREGDLRLSQAESFAPILVAPAG